MKNLSKVLAVVLAFAMALSMVSFAAFSDIESGDNCEEAVTVLSSLGILSGYTDGTFKPENTITRAEFASVVIRMLGFGDIASGGSVVFSDVPADHWANGVISLAAHQGIIAGYGDGRFGPEDPVNYEQAIAMVVRALGYTPMADANGGYPGGYQVVASQKGLLNGTSGAPGLPANRGTVAQFVYNSLTVPMMEQVSYGTETKYMPVKKLILNLHNVTKLEGNISNTAASDAKTAAGTVKVVYSAQVSAPTDNEALAIRYESSSSLAYPYVKNVSAEKVKAGTATEVELKVSAAVEAEAKELMDVASIMFVKNADNSKSDELLCIVKDDSKNAIVEFVSEDVAKNIDKDGDKNAAIQVYTDKEAGEYEEYEIALTKLYVNDRKADVAKFTDYAKKGETNNDIKLLANSDDEDLFTVAYITDWEDAVVESISEKSYKVYTSGKTLVLDETDEDKKFVIYKDGKEASFADIKENDVLSYYGKLTTADTADHYGVVHIVSDKVEGKVTGTATNTIFVDGTSYKVDPKKVDVANDIKMGNSYTFYKNARGIIVGEDKTESKSNLKYGFVSYFYNNADTEQSSVRLLTADGVWATIECPAKFALNGNSVYESEAKWITGLGLENVISETGTKSETRYAANMVVAYELTANGEIAELYTADVDKEVFAASNLDKPSNSTDKTSTYSAAKGKLGSYVVDDSTIIFNIDKDAKLNKYEVGKNGAAKDKDVSVVAVSTLLDATDYNVMNGYNKDDDTGIWAVLCGNDIVSDINWASDFFVVSSDPVQTTNEAGDSGYIFKGLQAGEEVELFVNTDNVNGIDVNDIVEVTEYKTAEAKTAKVGIEDIAKGDILLYGLTATGEAAKIVRLVDVSDLYADSAMGALKDILNKGGNSVLTTIEIANTEYSFVLGYAVERKDAKILLANTGDSYDAAKKEYVGADEYRFDADVLGAAYDKTIGETGKVTEVAYGDINFDRYFAQKDGDGNDMSEKSGDFVFARVEDGYDIVDFAVIRNIVD